MKKSQRAKNYNFDAIFKMTNKNLNSLKNFLKIKVFKLSLIFYFDIQTNFSKSKRTNKKNDMLR